MIRICSRCHKQFDEPHEFKLCNACREYSREQTRKWCEANRDRSRETKRKTYHKHSEKYLEQKKEYRQRPEIKEHMSVQAKSYRELHREVASENMKQWYQDNKERHFENVARWKYTHPEEWNAIKANGHNKRRTRIKSNGGKLTAEHLKELTYKQENKCYYCGTLFFNGDLNFDRHIEHKVPLSRGGTNDIANIVLSCSTCNMRKHTMTHDEFLQARNA